MERRLKRMKFSKMPAFATLVFMALVPKMNSEVQSNFREDTTFRPYWNVPVEKCQHFGITFDLDKFNIVHNENNNFRGSKVNIYYRPGAFPNYDSAGKPLNGGIPQRGDLSLHVATLKKEITSYQAANYSGVSVMDFEDYLPEYNGYLPKIFREASMNWAKQMHPDWSYDQLTNLSTETFNDEIKPYFKLPLTINQNLTEKAMVGYYHYPYCKNYDAPYNKCKTDMQALNDRLQDTIFEASTALYPSAYIFKEHGDLYYNHLKTVFDETERVNRINLPILPYYWYRYHNDNTTYLPNNTALHTLWLMKSRGYQGVMIWGSDHTSDLGTKPNCIKFQNYVESFLGPTLKCLTRMPQTLVEAINLRFPLETTTDKASKQAADTLLSFVLMICKLQHLWQ